MPTICNSTNVSFSLTTPGGGSVVSKNLYLSNFSVTLGIGSSSSVLNLELVIDPCANQPQGTIAEVGTPVLLRIYGPSGGDGFSFGGILTSATETLSSNGLRYNMQIIDPRKILENVSVLLKGYYCPIPQLESNNLMNAAYWMHQGVAICPPGNDTENWPRMGNCNNWGRSAGVDTQVYLLDALAAIQRNNRGIYTTNGRYKLSLNLALLINTLFARAPYARTGSSETSLLNLISEACDACGCDFYVTLVGYSITINLIDRTIIPSDNNPIQAIINAGYATGRCTKGERGYEEIYGNSNKLVLGDNVHYLANVVTEQSARMVLGYDLDGFPVQVNGINFTVPINISPLSSIINGLPPMYPISEEEILCSGSIELWKLYGAIKPNSLSGLLIDILGMRADFAGALAAAKALLDFAQNLDIDAFGTALEAIGGISSVLAKTKTIVLYEQAYSWFTQFIRTWYGKRWLVPVNQICAYAPYGLYADTASENGSVVLSDVPVDSAYGNPNNRMGIIDPSLFLTSDGKVNGFGVLSLDGQRARRLFNNNINFVFSDISDNNYVLQQSNRRIYGPLTTTGEVFNNRQRGTNDVIISTPFIGLRPKLDNKIYTQGLRTLAALMGQEQWISQNAQGLKGYVDKSSVNIFRLNNAAAMYYAVNIPMRSNTYVYGPWIGTNGTVGSTEIVKSNLNPWAYGDYAGMNVVGNAMAFAGLRFTNKTESGSFTLAEPPAYSIGMFRNSQCVISSINVNYNDSGVTSEYSFKVYSAKFGQFAKALSDEVQKFNKERYRILDIIRKERIAGLNLVTENRKALLQRLKDNNMQDFLIDAPPSPNNTASPAILFVGGYFNAETRGNPSFDPSTEYISTDYSSSENGPANGYSPETYCCGCDPSLHSSGGDQLPVSPGTNKKHYLVGLNTSKEIESSVDNNTPIFNMAMMSLDGLISPVSLKGRNKRLSPFFRSWDSSEDNKNTVSSSVPPLDRKGLNDDRQLPINQKYLNPIVSTSILNNEWDNRGNSKSTNILLLSFGNSINNIKAMHDSKRYDNENDFGFYALRGPLVLQGWGYDLDGKPIPNVVDKESDAELGVFRNKRLKNKFMKNWLSNPKTWPVAPIDLRFDRQRGVWVSAPVYETFIVAQLLENIEIRGKGNAAILNPGKGKIELHDFLGKEHYRGSIVYAKYNNGKYIIVEEQTSAPMIVSGYAVESFTPEQSDNIKVNVGGAGSTTGCVDGLTPPNKPYVTNPMGYGANQGDLVIILRICGTTTSECPGAKYIVIGTGAPPGECSSIESPGYVDSPSPVNNTSPYLNYTNE